VRSKGSELHNASLYDRPTPLTRHFAPRLNLFAIRFIHRSLPHIATTYALAMGEVPCTLLGVKNDFELERMLMAARSMKDVEFSLNGDEGELPLKEEEKEVLQTLIKDNEIFGGGVQNTEGWKEV